MACFSVLTLQGLSLSLRAESHERHVTMLRFTLCVTNDKHTRQHYIFISNLPYKHINYLDKHVIHPINTPRGTDRENLHMTAKIDMQAGPSD